jgi:hypothetical protein
MACTYKTIMCGLWTKHVKCVSWDAKIKFSLDKIWDWCFCVAPWNASWFLLFVLRLPTTILHSITSHKSNTHLFSYLVSSKKKKLYFLLYKVGNLYKQCWHDFWGVIRAPTGHENLFILKTLVRAFSSHS